MENLSKLINDKLQDLNLFVSDINYVKGNPNTLYITLDSENIIDMEKIVAATKKISPVIDNCKITGDSYVLDVSSKEKGSDINE